MFGGAACDCRELREKALEQARPYVGGGAVVGIGRMQSGGVIPQGGFALVSIAAASSARSSNTLGEELLHAWSVAWSGLANLVRCTKSNL